MADGVPDDAPKSARPGADPVPLMGRLILIAMVGAAATGIAGLFAGIALLASTGATERVAGGLALVAAALGFGLLANALLRR